MRIKLLAKLLFGWDVLFTYIDRWQLRKYLILRETLGEWEEEDFDKELHDLKIESSDLEEYENWNDVQ